MRTKAEQQIRHCSRRFCERFGIYLDNNTQHKIIQQIQKGKAKFVERQSLRITVFEIEIEGELVKIVYDKIRKTIVTALYPEREI